MTKVRRPAANWGRRLTAEEEKDLARKIRAAESKARQAISNIEEARRELARRPSRAERTRAGTVDRIERAVNAAWEASRTNPAMSGRRIAHGEARKLAGPYMDEIDLVQEGYIGLLRAAKRFDPDRDIRFSTYARWWVRAQMTRAIDHTGRTVRLPGCAVEQTRNLRKAIKQFDALGERYSIADLAGEVGIDERRARFLLSQGQTVSFEEPVEEGPRPRSIEQFLSDETILDPDSEAVRQQEIARMLEGIETVLNDRHRYVLTRRYGLSDDSFRTLSQVGKGMDLSRERVRQIEREALDRLRDHAKIRDVA